MQSIKNEWATALSPYCIVPITFLSLREDCVQLPARKLVCSGIVNPPCIHRIDRKIHRRTRILQKGGLNPNRQPIRTGKTVAVVGSGPAGLAAAQQLNRAGHTVTVFERDNKIGGLLRYGIPDFKMEKNIIDRRIEILEAEGIIFKCNAEVGKTISAETIESEFDAIVLCTGASIKRELPIPGADLNGVVQAMDFLPHNNKAVDGQHQREDKYLAKDRNVIVIGGGDTGFRLYWNFQPPRCKKRYQFRNHAKARRWKNRRQPMALLALQTKNQFFSRRREPQRVEHPNQRIYW